jgi:hypothetical protein
MSLWVKAKKWLLNETKRQQQEYEKAKESLAGCKYQEHI